MCYYGVNSISIGERLTLIIGANGDGKTKFFEALEWLFDTNRSMDTKYVSKKRFSELMGDESDYVKVSILYEHNGSERILEKSFKFSKSIDNEINISGYNYRLFIQDGAEKMCYENDHAKKQFDLDFNVSVRKYSLFKGEQELNIFNRSDAMKYLIENFSAIRDFDPYINFLSRAKDLSQTATEHAMKTDKKNCKEADGLQRAMREEEKKIGELSAELLTKKSEATNFSELLNNLENSKEASELLATTKDRLENLQEDLLQTQRSLNENYTFRLLDELWILMGFQGIAEEYRIKVGNLDSEQRRLEREFQREQGAKKLANQLQTQINQGFVPLALNIPDENTMREMLHDEVCKVCGTPAPKGSLPYNTMKKHLDDYLASIKKVSEDEEEEVTLFVREYIKELTGKYTLLHLNKGRLAKIPFMISSSIEANRKLHQKIDNLQAHIEEEEERKKKILAQADGLSEEVLLSNLKNINEWWRLRRDAEKSVEILEMQIEKHKEKLAEYQDRYSEISKDSPAATYSRTSTAIRRISEAFDQAKQQNKRDFLTKLEEGTNEYLNKLNRNDFTGTARILETVDDSAELVLVDRDEAKIYNPNTALKTTMYMALLFAIAKMASEKHGVGYPMLFDAPTSSFTTAKESDFFGIVSDIERQTIIVTKSFLTEDENGNLELDQDKVKNLGCSVYRIEKKKPFDEKDLSTIQTTINKIK
jgi:DNA sulfur modification protein DndD